MKLISVNTGNNFQKRLKIRFRANVFCDFSGLYPEIIFATTVEPLLRGHPDERPPPMERPLDNVNLNINVLIPTPEERPPLLKGHFSDAKGVASQEGFHCTSFLMPLITGFSEAYQEVILVC